MATTVSGTHWLHDDRDVTQIGWVYPAIAGALIMLAGVAALARPTLATIAVEIFIGWMLVLGGIFGMIALFRSTGVMNFLWNLITSALAVAAGLLLLTRPTVGMIPLTLVLVAYFVLQGATLIVAAFDYRHRVPGGWGWLLFAGAVDLLLAVIVFAGLPGTALWALGVIAGVNLISWGLALLFFALAVRAIKKERKAG